VRCLIVDDSEHIAASMARLLVSQGLDVVACARTAGEALERAAALAPDVAIVDVELGEEDGIALSHELVVCAPSMRVVLISAHEEDDLGNLLDNSPAAGFLSKTAVGADAIARVLG
jgi:two-component system nitrate/nitrite response regulator NarL